MTSHDPIKVRVDHLLANERLRPGPMDDLGACVHAVAVALTDIGGATLVHNAAAVIRGVTDCWATRPNEAEILRAATWVTKQDPEAVLRSVEARAGGKTIDSLTERVEAAISGKMQSLDWPWASLGSLTRSLMPGGITIIVGNPGTSKSFLLLQAVLHWQRECIRSSLLELEEDPGFWLNRALALVSGKGSATDPAWISRYPDEARQMLVDHKEQLQGLAENLEVAPPQGMTLDTLAQWIEKQCQDGNRIICCDPITAASTGSTHPWLAAEVFMMKAKKSIVKHGASLVMTTHPRKGSGQLNKALPDQDCIAGGAAFGRFASTILWLEGNSTDECVSVMDTDGREHGAVINRRIRILKSREGRGAGMILGMNFEGLTLSIKEEGVLTNTDNQKTRAKKAVKRKPLTDTTRETDAEQAADWITR